MGSPFLGGEATLTLDGWKAPRQEDTDRLNRMFKPDGVAGHPYVIAFEDAAKFYGAEILEMTIPDEEPGLVY